MRFHKTYYMPTIYRYLYLSNVYLLHGLIRTKCEFSMKYVRALSLPPTRRLMIKPDIIGYKKRLSSEPQGIPVKGFQLACVVAIYSTNQQWTNEMIGYCEEQFKGRCKMHMRYLRYKLILAHLSQ